MAKAGELDWSNLMKGDVGEPEHPLSKALVSDSNKGGENITKDDLQKDVNFIMDGFNSPSLKQPSKEEFKERIAQIYPESARTSEEWDKIEKTWDSSIDNHIKRLENTKVQVEPDNYEEFAKGKSFNDAISREEALERNMYVEQ